MRLPLFLSLACLVLFCTAEEARIFVEDDVVMVAGEDVHLMFGGKQAPEKTKDEV